LHVVWLIIIVGVTAVIQIAAVVSILRDPSVAEWVSVLVALYVLSISLAGYGMSKLYGIGGAKNKTPVHLPDARQGQRPTLTTSPLTSLREALPAAESDLVTVQGNKPPKTLMISFIINGIVGLLIGVVSVSWFEVLAACVGWGVGIWLLILVALRTGQGPIKPSSGLFFSSPRLTRFIVWWLIGFVPSVIVGSLIYALR
jgi:hypothetical protein